MTNNTKIIRVNFPRSAHGEEKLIPAEGGGAWDTREYDYFLIDPSEAVAKGDYAVVPARGYLQIVKVAAVGVRSTKATQHAIAIFNLDAHSNILERQKVKEELLQAIQNRMAHASFIANAQLLAASDPQLAALLQDFNSL